MRPVWRNALKVLYPQENACHLCDTWAKRGILCERCLLDMSLREIPSAIQARYRRDALLVAIARWHHAGVPRKLVHQFKYMGDLKAAEPLAEGMIQSLLLEGYMLACNPLVIPVPLYAAREKERGYNQAALLAQEICRVTGLTLHTDILYRTRATESMVGKDREARLTSMHGAFAVARADLTDGADILLVDDVFTTGATALSCAYALRRAGARNVSVVTACRA